MLYILLWLLFIGTKFGLLYPVCKLAKAQGKRAWVCALVGIFTSTTVVFIALLIASKEKKLVSEPS